jgi:hypothetical protein
MGERYAGVGRDGNGGTDARHDFERNLRFRQRFRFLAAASENERITALETNNVVARTSVCDENVVDVFLRDAVATRSLTDEYSQRARRDLFKQRGIDQSIIDDDLRPSQQVQTTNR